MACIDVAEHAFLDEGPRKDHRPVIRRQSSTVAQCTDDITETNNCAKDLGLKELRVEYSIPFLEQNNEECTRQVIEKHFQDQNHETEKDDIPDVLDNHKLLAKCSTNDNGDRSQFVNIHEGKQRDCSETFEAKEIEVTAATSCHSCDLNKKRTLEEVFAELCKTMNESRWIELLQMLWEKCAFQNTTLEKSIEVPVFTHNALHQAIQKFGAIQLSLQRKGSLVFKNVEYRHHRVLVKESDTTYREFESLGSFSNLLRLQSIANFQSNESCVDDLKNKALYDFDNGVFIVLNPELCSQGEHDIEAVKCRAEQCHHLLDKYFYLFSSINCENVATNIMTGRGYSEQLGEMPTGMWILCDVMDNFCYYKYLIVLILSFLLLDSSYCFLLECIFLIITYEEEWENMDLELKQERYSQRHISKMTLAFICKRLFCGLGLGSSVASCFLTVVLPVTFGLLFNCLITDKQNRPIVERRATLGVKFTERLPDQSVRKKRAVG